MTLTYSLTFFWVCVPAFFFFFFFAALSVVVNWLRSVHLFFSSSSLRTISHFLNPRCCHLPTSSPQRPSHSTQHHPTIERIHPPPSLTLFNICRSFSHNNDSLRVQSSSRGKRRWLPSSSSSLRNLSARGNSDRLSRMGPRTSGSCCLLLPPPSLSGDGGDDDGDAVVVVVVVVAEEEISCARARKRVGGQVQSEECQRCIVRESRKAPHRLPLFTVRYALPPPSLLSLPIVGQRMPFFPTLSFAKKKREWRRDVQKFCCVFFSDDIEAGRPIRDVKIFFYSSVSSSSSRARIIGRIANKQKMREKTSRPLHEVVMQKRGGGGSFLVPSLPPPLPPSRPSGFCPLNCLHLLLLLSPPPQRRGRVKRRKKK